MAAQPQSFPPSAPPVPLSSAVWARLEETLGRFEDAWQRGARPAIEDYLPAAQEPVERRALLRELIHADLQFRLRAGEAARAEDYFDRYPELCADHFAALSLITAEYTLRCRRGEHEALLEFLRRYPDFHDDLPGRDSSARPSPKAVGERPTGHTAGVWAASPTLTVSPSSRTQGGPVLPCRFGDYELLEELARGGMGVVYKARQRVGDGERVVALKVIQAGRLASPRAAERFLQEARAAAALDHPAIVPIYDIGEAEGQHYFTMPLLTGGTLADRVRHGPLPPQLAARLVRQVAEAVQHAHGRGVIHRDLKPANILLAGEERRAKSQEPEGDSGSPLSPPGSRLLPKVTDFGLARLHESGLSVTGEALGTPSFMPPEQAHGQVRATGPASDVYGLGAVLYCLLTGRPPFQAADVLETMRQVCQDEPVPPRQINPQVPRDLETVCLKCLQKEPGRRYATARDVAEELGRFERGEPVVARPVGRPERLWRWARRKPAVAALLALTLLLLAAGTAVSTLFALDAAEQARQAEARAKENQRLAGQEALARAAADRRRREAVKLAGERAQALEDLQREQAKVREELAKAEFVAYAFQVRAAQAELERGRTGEAAALLRVCDPKLQGWEHDYLLRQTRRDVWTGDHTHTVHAVAYRPDGERLATGSADGTATLWDARSGHKLLAIQVGKGAKGSVRAVAYSPDGGRLATACEDGTAKVWDAATGRELLALDDHPGAVVAVAYSPDGKRLATASLPAAGWFQRPGTVKVWDLATGRTAFTLEGHAHPVAVVYSPDGKRLATASMSLIREGPGELKVWDAATGQGVLSFKGDTNGIRALAYRPDGKRLATGAESGQVTVWDTQTGQELLTLEANDWVSALAYSPDGKRLATSAAACTVLVRDAATGQQLLSLKGHTHAIHAVAYSPDGKRLATGSQDRTAKVWEVGPGLEALTLKPRRDRAELAGKCLLGLRGGTVKVWDTPAGLEARAVTGHDKAVAALFRRGHVAAVVYGPDGRRFVTFSEGLAEIDVWAAAAGQRAFSLKGHAGGVCAAVFSADGKRLATGSMDGTAKVWDAQTGREILTLKDREKRWVTAVAFSPDGRHLAGVLTGNAVKMWDLQTGRELFALRGHTAVAFSPDGKRLATAAEGRTAKVWDAETGREVVTLRGHADHVLAVTFGPDGRRLVTGSKDCTVKVWDARTGQEALTLKGHPDQVYLVAYSPDGRRLFSACMNNPAFKVWDATLWRYVASFKGHTDTVHAVAYSPDGKRLASASWDGTVRVWDALAGREVLCLTQAAYHVAYSPDGKRLAATLADGTVTVWETATGRQRLALKGESAQSLAYGPDGERLAATTAGGKVVVWNAATGQRLLALKMPALNQVEDRAWCVAYRCDGKHLATGSEQGTVRVWDAATGQPLLSLKGPTQGPEAAAHSITAVVYSPDGKHLAAASSGGTVWVWDAATGQPLLSLKGHTSAVHGLAYSPDGAYLASVSRDRTVRVWDAATGRQFLVLDRYAAGPARVAFSPDGKRLATAGDRTVLVFHLERLLAERARREEQ